MLCLCELFVFSNSLTYPELDLSETSLFEEVLLVEVDDSCDWLYFSAVLGEDCMQPMVIEFENNWDLSFGGGVLFLVTFEKSIVF